MDFGIAKFRIAKFSHCEIGIGIAKWTLALRNFRNVKFRKGQFSQSYSVLGILDFAMRNRFANSLRNFRIAKLVCEQFAKILFC